MSKLLITIIKQLLAQSEADTGNFATAQVKVDWLVGVCTELAPVGDFTCEDLLELFTAYLFYQLIFFVCDHYQGIPSDRNKHQFVFQRFDLITAVFIHINKWHSTASPEIAFT